MNKTLFNLYRPGKDNQAADTFTRISSNGHIRNSKNYIHEQLPILV